MSTYHQLEWSHAYTGRLTAQDSTPKSDPNAAAICTRFCTEVEAGILPFVSMPYMDSLKNDIAHMLPKLQKFEHMLVLGIGGSALGARALQKAFAPGQDGPCHEGPWLWVADNVCPDNFDALLGKLPVEKTVVVCISKSGGTIETLGQYFLVRQWLKESLGDAWANHMIVVTDKNKGFLREQANEFSLMSLEVPDHLGGRYSALSAVGMLPCAFMGIDWEGLLDGAASVAKPLLAAAKDTATFAKHPAFTLASWAKTLEDNDYSQLIFFSYIPSWSYLGAWFAQLWAESIGKEGKGTMPIPAVGVTDQHSVQQMFLDGQRDKGCLFLSQHTQENTLKGRIFPDSLPEAWQWLRGKPFGALLEAEGIGTRMALTQSNVPLVHICMQNNTAHAAGALMMLLEATTVFTGWLMDINPIDQPAVELGKRLANARLGAPGYATEEEALKKYQSIAKSIQEF